MVRCIIAGFGILGFLSCDRAAGQYDNCTTSSMTALGNGRCDSSNNNPLCGYDGGDCCACTCIDDEYSCSSNEFDCLDPACLDFAVAPENTNCTGNSTILNDGRCDQENNNPSCGYDGGDCCMCTCIDASGGACQFSDLECLDPGADDGIHNCKSPLPAAVPCSADAQRTWVVEDSAQARALAAAANCSGGAFEVEWRGNVVVDKAIYVVNGTVLNVTGIGSSAGIYGNTSTRLFVIVNASLHLSGVSLSYGSGIVGGAIAASESSLTFKRTAFLSNNVEGNGGALYVSDGSSASFFDGTHFSDNRAAGEGGAVYVSNSSVAVWHGETSFTNNTARNDGGALVVDSGSSVSWSENTIFVANRAGGDGGALFARNGSKVFWDAATAFYSNSALAHGGALVTSDSSSVSWSGPTTFEGNSAEEFAGALFVHYGSTASWSGETTFAANKAGDIGGAVLVWSQSSVSWNGKMTASANTAKNAGGAMAVAADSSLWWTGEALFIGNSAPAGGAMYAVINSDVSIDGDTTFRGNSAVTDSTDANLVRAGGALAVSDSEFTCSGNITFADNIAYAGGAVYAAAASFLWNGRTMFLRNSADMVGGALVVNENSTFRWIRETTFAGNSASAGGALVVYAANVSWDGNAEFFNNSANHGILGQGGALAIYLHSRVRWNGATTFTGNSALSAGGAILAYEASVVSWGGKMELSNNSAGSGGAVCAIFHSSIEWSGETTLALNSALGTETVGGGGGALLARDGSDVSWSGATRFINNFAGMYGGAVSVEGSNVYWSGETVCFGNAAETGGAIYVTNGSFVRWSGTTEFTFNEAFDNGGAVGSYAPDSVINSVDSILAINGTTSFINNTCGANGGALALLGALSSAFEAGRVSFVGNSAQVTGGAVFVTGAGVGPRFYNITFVSNSAQVGGGIYAAGSGNAKNSIAGVEAPNPTIIDGCLFIGNRATATGGAVDSAAGQDVIVNTSFVQNTAREGGALRLAGTVYLDSCSFVENVSDEDGGAAVSNIGYISSMTNIYFADNVFNCVPSKFLDFNPEGDLYEAVCSGCETSETSCQNCSFNERHLVPSCKDVIDHATSLGGLVTLAMLTIDPGYWRATTSSPHALACYNADACLGGVTATSGYCLEGYEGPYCSVCADGYTSNLGFTCSRCSGNTKGIVVAVALLVVFLIAAVVMALYLVSEELEGTARGVVDRIKRYIPLQSLKIAIVVWQILTQFAGVANVTYYDVYQHFLDGVEVLNFDIGWVLSAACIVDADFHDRLLLSTIAPIIALGFLGATYAVAVRRSRQSDEALQRVRHKHVSMVLLLTFLVYSSVSSVLFQTFACEHLDDDKNYLRADYRIECNSSRHKAFKIYAGLMIVLYTAGIPTLYTVLLFRDRALLVEKKTTRTDTWRVSAISNLWDPYKPSVFYYEVIECARRILLAGTVVFIYPNTAAQIAVTLTIAFVFSVLAEAMAPYDCDWDTWISRVGHVVVYVSMYVALLVKVDVSDERASSQRVFEAVIVTAHVCMILAIVWEGVTVACSLTASMQEETAPSQGLRPTISRFCRQRILCSRRGR